MALERITNVRRVAVVGRRATWLKAELKRRGLALSAKPQLVFTHGGDGTILFAESKFPEVPKVTLRAGRNCTKCDFDAGRSTIGSGRFKCKSCLDDVLDRLAAGKPLALREWFKLEGKAITRHGNASDVALNEVQVHNNSPLHAVRGSVKVNGKLVFKDFVSDGVIISTPFGSTGYFYSASKEKFTRGIGICLNNPTKPSKPIIVSEDAVVEITISRRHGLFVADNHAKTKLLAEGDRVIVRKSKQVARFVEA